MDIEMNLREYLREWRDVDIVQYELACILGIIDREKYNFHVHTKHVFWSRHELGNALFFIIRELSRAGVLEFDEEELRVRWNPRYRGSWEKD